MGVGVWVCVCVGGGGGAEDPPCTVDCRRHVLPSVLTSRRHRSNTSVRPRLTANEAADLKTQKCKYFEIFWTLGVKVSIFYEGSADGQRQCQTTVPSDLVLQNGRNSILFYSGKI